MKSKENHFEEALPASKSQRRREALEIKSLASELIGLSPARLASVPMDDDLAEAIGHARKIRSNVARKRQMQYVAKLLRRIDPEPIVQTLKEFDTEARHLRVRHHRCETWRDHLLETADAGVAELMKQRSGTDSQAIRQLIRNARNEFARGKPPSAARSLFRTLREMDEAEPLPPLPGAL